MKKLLFFVLLLNIFSYSAQSATIVTPPLVEPKVGGEYYTRYTIYHERGIHHTTNFARGYVLPVNSKVKLLSKSYEKGGGLVIRDLETGSDINVINNHAHTNVDIDVVAKRMLSNEMTVLDGLPADQQAAIASGRLVIGMTKEVALIARGYPPVTLTPNISFHQWTYQSSRFVKHTVVFSNDGVITGGRGL